MERNWLVVLTPYQPAFEDMHCRKQARAIVQVPIELEDMIVVDQGILCVQIRNGGV